VCTLAGGRPSRGGRLVCVSVWAQPGAGALWPPSESAAPRPAHGSALTAGQHAGRGGLLTSSRCRAGEASPGRLLDQHLAHELLTAASPRMSLTSTLPTTSAFRLVHTYGPRSTKSGVASVGRAYIADVTSPSHRTDTMGKAGAVMMVGYAVGAPLGGTCMLDLRPSPACRPQPQSHPRPYPHPQPSRSTSRSL